MDIKELSKKYNRAKAYKDGMKTPFFKELVKKLESEIDIAMKACVASVVDNEHELIVKCRAYKELLMFFEAQPAKADRFKAELEKIKKTKVA